MHGAGSSSLLVGRGLRRRVSVRRPAGGLPVEAAKSSADAGGREASSARGPLPGFTEVFCEWPGESELGVGDDDQPGPAIGGCGLAEFGNGSSPGSA